MLSIEPRDRRFDEFLKFFEKFDREILLQKSGLAALLHGFNENVFDI